MRASIDRLLCIGVPVDVLRPADCTGMPGASLCPGDCWLMAEFMADVSSCDEDMDSMEELCKQENNADLCYFNVDTKQTKKILCFT